MRPSFITEPHGHRDAEVAGGDRGDIHNRCSGRAMNRVERGYSNQESPRRGCVFHPGYAVQALIGSDRNGERTE